MRYQTYFGVPIPPFKEQKLGAGSTTIRFVLTGKVPSKKNHQQSVAVRKQAYQFLHELKSPTITKAQAIKAVRLVHSKVRPNTEYTDYVALQKPVLQSQALWWSNRLQSKGLIFPISQATLSLRFYFHTKHIQDTLNKQQSIQDLLIAANIITNDDYKTINPIHSASHCYHEEILDTITFISLSFRLSK